MIEIMNNGKYERVCQNFKDRGCILLTTKDKFHELRESKTRSIPKYRYVASCGHEHAVHYNVFIQRGTGVKCPKCVIEHNGKTKQGDASRTKEGTSLLLHNEDIAREYLSDLLQDDFDVRKISDGCLADMAIRPKVSNKDEWLQLQIKSSSQQPDRGYSFNCRHGNYPNCVIACVSLCDKRIWLFNGNEMKNRKISIGLYKSKYDKNYATSANHLQDLMTMYTLTIPLSPLVSIETPVSMYNQIEMAYRVLRETKCFAVPYTYPEKSNLVYDFLIGDFKVQEKTASTVGRKKAIVVSIGKRNGTVCKVSKYQQYVMGDNDFYWIHAPDKRTFWFVPEYVLIEKGFVSTKSSVAKKTINTVMHKWLDTYKFDYDNFDIDQFEVILGRKISEL
jgi:hypothetical protein